MSELLNFILNHEEQFRRARIASLYSDFRVQQTTNPDGYAANISAWQLALAHATRKGLIPSAGAASNDLLTLRTGEELLRALETKEWGRPLALGAVVSEALVRKKMIPLNEFLRATKSVYARSWVITPWQIAVWGLRQLGLAGGTMGEDRLAIGKFVVLGNVEEAAKSALKRMEDRTSRTDRIFSRDMFEREFAGVFDEEQSLTQSDFQVLYTFLSRDKREIAYDGQTIKFKSSTTVFPSSVTDQDTTIASLKTLIASLTTQTSTLQLRIKTLSNAVRTAISQKNRLQATTSLRSQKLAEAALKQRSETLSQLEEVYNRIEQAADQVEIVRVMSASTGVLKSLNKEVGGVERVEDVVEGLRVEMEKVEDVGGVLGENALTGVGVDDLELEGELEIMEREEREKREKVEVEEVGKRFEEIEKGEEERRKVKELKGERDRSAVGHGQELDSHVEEEVQESIHGLDRMSLDEVRPMTTESKTSDKHQESPKALPAE
ncbi:MAG: hypothetical protein M1812_000842 [Candelaria pacifica]|nr:MAG: hypothetical protein M1812_000842 [Candelaria pacifica]